MPSLLDIQLASQSPLVRGLLSQGKQKGNLTGVGGLSNLTGVQAAPPTPAPTPPLPQPASSPPPGSPSNLGPSGSVGAPGAVDIRQLFEQAGFLMSDSGRKRPALDARETLVMTGLALLGGGRNATFGQALATGIMAGRQAAANTAALQAVEVAAQQRTQRYLTVFGEGPLTRSSVDNAIKLATIEGDDDALRVLADLREQLPDGKEPERTFRQLETGESVFTDETGAVFNADGTRVTAADLEMFRERGVKPDSEITIRNGRAFAMDPDTLKFRDAQGRVHDSLPQEATPAVRPSRVTMEDEQGNTISVMEDPFTGQTIPNTERLVKRADTSVDAEAQLTAQILNRELGIINELLGDDPSTPEVELPGADEFRALGARFGLINSMKPERFRSSELQQLNAAVGNIARVVIRQTSGTAASDRERESILEIIAPKPGNTRETVLAKLARVQHMIDLAGVNPTATADAMLTDLRGNGNLDGFFGTQSQTGGQQDVQSVIQGIDALGGGR